MSDLKPSLSSILVQKHSAKPISSHADYGAANLDSFLKEAYQINRSISSLLSYLRAIRTPYLSTAPPARQPKRPQTIVPHISASTLTSTDIPEHLTDAQREAIDRQTSSVLRDINNHIINISSAVNLQHETSTKVLEKTYGQPNSVLWRWAAGDGDAPDAGKPEEQLAEEGKVKMLKSMRDGVLWYLGKLLKDAVTAQQEMVEKRLDREREKQMSVLYDPRNKGVKARSDVENLLNGTEIKSGRDLRGHDKYNPALDPSQGGEQELTSEQLQLFEEENKGIFEHFNDQLARVTQVEKSLLEIGSLQQTLVGHLGVQGEMIEQLVQDAATTDENVRKGNRELKKASERSSTARLVFYATAGFCSFLVVWDLII